MRDVMLITHFIGLAMGLGTSFSMMYFGKLGAKMEPQERSDFMMKVVGLSRVGQIGILVLFISGGYLMTPHWSSLGTMPTMIAKLILFVILGGLLGVISSTIRKAKNGQPELLARFSKLGPAAMITSLAIVVLAVLTFH